MTFHTPNVPETIMINHGVLLRLMLMENMSKENGETAIATVKQVYHFWFIKPMKKCKKCFLYKSAATPTNQSPPLLRHLCPIHVVTFTLISILSTNYIQKRRDQALFFSFGI